MTDLEEFAKRGQKAQAAVDKLTLEYPSNYGRGVHPDLDLVWDLIDTFPELTPARRFLLAGMVMGLMMKTRGEEKKRAAGEPRVPS